MDAAGPPRRATTPGTLHPQRVPSGTPASPGCRAVAILLGLLLIIMGVLLALLIASSRRLMQQVANAQDALQRIPPPGPELVALDKEAANTRRVLAFLERWREATFAEQPDWARILAVLGDHDPQRIRFTNLFQEGRVLSVVGIAQARPEVEAFAQELERSQVFDQVTVELLEEAQLPSPEPASPTVAPPPTITPTSERTLYDAFEIDDFAPAAISPGAMQRHNFNPFADMDQVVFTGKAGHRYCIVALPEAAGVDTMVEVLMGGSTWSNDNCTAPQIPLRFCQCPGGSMAALASLVEIEVAAAQDQQVIVQVRNRGNYGADTWYTLAVIEQPLLVTPTVATALVGDAYEPDDPVPSPISLYEQQRHTFFPDGDRDRVDFGVKAGRTYEIKTFDLAVGVDTVLAVNVAGVLYENDDASPGDLSSAVTFVAPIDTKASALVTNRDRFGPDKAYSLTLIELGPTLEPSYTPTPSETPVQGDAYEPDDVERFISVGEVQRHTFYPPADVDRLTLLVKAERRYAVFTCGNPFNPLTDRICAPLMPGVDTILVLAGPIRNCVPPACQSDDAFPGTGHRGSRVEFDALNSGRVSIVIYNRGSFGPGQEYYVRVDEIGVVPSPEPPTATVTPTPTNTGTPTPSSTPSPTPTPSPSPTESIVLLRHPGPAWSGGSVSLARTGADGALYLVSWRQSAGGRYATGRGSAPGSMQGTPSASAAWPVRFVLSLRLKGGSP